MAHVLVVGGTSMLEQVSQFLAERNNIVTVISRNAESLARYPLELASGLGKIIPVHLNYLHLDSLKQGLSNLYQKYGPVTLALVRGKDKTGAVEETVAEFINSTSPICRIFHIVEENGSGDPLTKERVLEKLSNDYSRVLYRRITVEHALTPEGNHRHLPMPFVCDGVIEALQNDNKHQIISLDKPEAVSSMTA